MLKVEKITTREGLHRLEPIWNPLLAASASNNITLTFEWITTWWDIFSEGRELCVLVVRDGGDAIGIAPLLRRAVQHYGVLPFQRLEFLASGEDEADEICSDYLDFIFLRGREAEALRAVLHYLREEESNWDEVLLTDVSGDSPNLELLETLCETVGIKRSVVREQISIYAPLCGDWESFRSRLGGDLRSKIRRDRRLFEKTEGELRVIDGLEGFEAGFATFIDLHQSRWTARGKPGVFASRKFTQFHRLLAPKLLRKGWLQMQIAYASGEPLSALYLLTYFGKVSEYQSGLKQSAPATVGAVSSPAGVPGSLALDKAPSIRSPGTLIQSFAIENAIASGCREYDFLKGEAGSYKFIWGCQTRGLFQLRLARMRSKESLYHTTTKLVEGLRQMKRALKRYVV